MDHGALKMKALHPFKMSGITHTATQYHIQRTQTLSNTAVRTANLTSIEEEVVA
jgi:hypothetical protein